VGWQWYHPFSPQHYGRPPHRASGCWYDD
jgi:hypothetical protein